MMTTSNSGVSRQLFDTAMDLRDRGNWERAIEVLQELLEREERDISLRAHALLQLAHMLKLQNKLVEAERHLRQATAIAPRFELASLALFHVLDRMARGVESLQEALRFLALRESLGYRELFAGATFGGDLPENERPLAEAVRASLEQHRLAQRSRNAPMRGDTVRISLNASQDARPGSLGALREHHSKNSLAEIEFSDGHTVLIPVAWIDHREI